MCGLTGFMGSMQAPLETLQRMNQCILHRGPDSDGYWLDESAGIALGHRRLAVVDLSPAGHQPMASSSSRYVIAFNGEIYNHLDLRFALEQQGAAPAWLGHSDTETLLAGFDTWGIRTTVERTVGMFAFAVWDKQQRALTLGRDRIGEKPLYYGWQGLGAASIFLFGSELKALRAHPAFNASIDRNALALYMRHSYVPAPYAIYAGIKKLMPGTLLTVTREGPEPRIEAYWSCSDVIARGVAQPFPGTTTEAVEALEGVLKSAIGQQMMADVPLGAFLSGGVDSSTVVALMQAQSSRPVKTFSIGFHEAGYNEAIYAKDVAKHLGTDHTELYLSANQAMAVIPGLPILFDEPFADSSQIPTALVSQMARQHVTVSLSGDGGDELFAGYNRYHLTASSWSRLAFVPHSCRRAAAWAINQLSPTAWNRLAQVTPLAKRWSDVGYKLHKGAKVLVAESASEVYWGLVSQWDNPASVILGVGVHEPPTLLTGNQPFLMRLNDVERMMALDLLTYLPDDVLTKVDRAAMGVSLESRVPFLDHRVVEFAWSLPLNFKLYRDVNNYTTKWVLRQVLYRYVPQSLIERPKMGFGVPIGDWLRGPLRDWAEELIGESRLRSEGFFHPEPIVTKWAEHLTGTRDWSGHLWTVLMFQAWLEAQDK